MKQKTLKRRILKVRGKLKEVNKDRYRLSVFKSNKNIMAQIIDDQKSKTLITASSFEKNIKSIAKDKKKSDLSIIVGELLAKRATDKKINKIFFDRGRYKYHGRIKLLAETLRKNGLNF